MNAAMTGDWGRNKDLIPNIAGPGPTVYSRWQATTYKRGGGQEREFIGDLCVALRHRGIPNELFVIFTSYFDEADTHGSMPDVILAAHLGHEYQWRRFEKKLSRLQTKHKFKIFHAKEFRPRDDNELQLVSDLGQLVNDTLTEALVISLTRERYLNEYRAPPIPAKMNLDSQYGVCFRACIAHLLDIMEKRNFRDHLHVVMENGHPNVENCRAIFNEIKVAYLEAGIDVLGAFSIDKKETCLPLMVSDFFASLYSKMKDAKQVGFADYVNILPEAPKKGATLSFLELKADALTKLKDGFEKNKQRKMDEWRARRDAKKGVLGS